MEPSRLPPEWAAFQQEVEQWYEQPDWELMRAVLACARALDLPTRPFWLMVIGPSSSGKTELYLNAAAAYHNRALTSHLTIPGLLSMEKSKKGEGLLKQFQNSSGLWIIKDFSSILSMREERREELIGIMRELFDGRWDRGAGGSSETWVGRLNCLAAATPGVERFHHMSAELGERFLRARLPRPQASPRKAALQMGKRDYIGARVKSSVQAILKAASKPTTSPVFEDAIYNCAELCAQLRTNVVRNNLGDIHDIGMAEGNFRAYQSLLALAIADASLLQQEAVEEPQLRLCLRIALDSVPGPRAAIMRCLLAPKPVLVRQADMLAQTGLHEYAFSYHIEALIALNCLRRIEGNGRVDYVASERLCSLLPTLPDYGTLAQVVSIQRH